MKKRKIEPNQSICGGGNRQQSATDEHAAAPADPHSPLAAFLLETYLMGSLSLALVQHIALLSLSEQREHPDLVRLSKLGHSGLQAGNLKKELFRAMVPFAIESAVMSFKVMMKLSGVLTSMAVEIMYPHVAFAKLFLNYPAEFAKRMYGNSVQSITDFWSAQVDHPAYASHPMHGHKFPVKTRGVPCFLHGDEVESIGIGKVWSRAIDCLSWGSMLALPGKAEDVHLIIWLLFTNLLGKASDGAEAAKILWRHLVWSLYWLYRGVWPECDPYGTPYTHGKEFERKLTPLAGVFFAVLWDLRADPPWLQSNLHLSDTAGGKPCKSGGCTTGGACSWTNCSGTSAPWVATTWTNETFASHYGDFQHRLLRVLPGFGITMYIVDVLHAKWLGADQFFLGSVLCLLTHYVMMGGAKENLVVLVQAITTQYEEDGVPARWRYPSLRITQYKSGKATALPKLKGAGMQCKSLSVVMPAVFRKFMDASNPRHQKVLLGLETIKETNTILDSNRCAYRLPTPAADRLIELSFLIAQITTSLIKYYHPRLIPLFHFTQKQHDCLHLALVGPFTNPMHGDCGSGEELMKVAKKLIRGSMFGNHPVKVGNVALHKYAKALHIKMDPAGPWWKR